MANALRSTAWMFCGAALLACHAIDIEKATYAGNCGTPVDVTDRVAESCDDEGCVCGKSCFAPRDDIAPGCAKDLVVKFNFKRDGSQTVTCGPSQNENYVFEVSADGEGSCAVGSDCIQSGNACGPANASNGACCTGFCDANGVCGL